MVLTPVKGCLSSKIDELASKSESKQAKAASSMSFMEAASRKHNLDLGWIFSHQMILLRKFLTDGSRVCVLVVSKCSQD